MINDGKCYIHIPSFLTLSALSAEAAAAVNAVHTALGLPAGFSAGDTNPHILALNDFDMGGAPFTRGTGAELAWLGPIDNQSFLTLDQLALIVAFGGDIEGYPVWFEIEDITAECPFAPEPAEGETKETWETWGTSGQSHLPREIGDYWYRSSAVGASGQLMNASQWVPLRSAGTVTVLTKSEYLAVLPTGEE